MKFNDKPNGLFPPPTAFSLFRASSYLSFKTRFNQRFSGTRLLLSSEPPLGLVPTSIAGSPGH